MEKSNIAYTDTLEPAHVMHVCKCILLLNKDLFIWNSNKARIYYSRGRIVHQVNEYKRFVPKPKSIEYCTRIPSPKTKNLQKKDYKHVVILFSLSIPNFVEKLAIPLAADLQTCLKVTANPDHSSWRGRFLHSTCLLYSIHRVPFYY